MRGCGCRRPRVDSLSAFHHARVDVRRSHAPTGRLCGVRSASPQSDHGHLLVHSVPVRAGLCLAPGDHLRGVFQDPPKHVSHGGPAPPAQPARAHQEGHADGRGHMPGVLHLLGAPLHFAAGTFERA